MLKVTAGSKRYKSKRKTLSVHTHTHTHTQKSKIEDVRLKSIYGIEKKTG